MAASNDGLAGKLLLVGKGHEQDRIGRGDADRHDRAHQRGNAERRAGDEQHDEDAAEGRRQRQQHHQRIAEVLIVHHHEQEHEHGGEQDADAEIAEAVFHALDLAGDCDVVAWLELRLQLVDDLLDLGCDAAEITVLDAGIDVVAPAGCWSDCCW